MLAAALRLIATHAVDLNVLAASDGRDPSASLIDRRGNPHAPDAELVVA